MRNNILIVNADSNVNTYLKELFCNCEGFEVVTANTGREAIDMLNTDQNFDLVLSGLKLDDITGSLLATKIKQQCPEMPVVILTNYEGEEIRSLVKASGAVYLHSPEMFGNPEYLCETVSDLINEKIPKVQEKGTVVYSKNYLSKFLPKQKIQFPDYLMSTR